MRNRLKQKKEKKNIKLIHVFKKFYYQVLRGEHFDSEKELKNQLDEIELSIKKVSTLK